MEREFEKNENKQLNPRQRTRRPGRAPSRSLTGVVDAEYTEVGVREEEPFAGEPSVPGAEDAAAAPETEEAQQPAVPAVPPAEQRREAGQAAGKHRREHREAPGQEKQAGRAKSPVTPFRAALAVLCFALIFAAGAFSMKLRWDQAEKEREAREEGVLQSIRTSLEEGNSVLKTLRDHYPDLLVLPGGSSYVFYPIDPELKPNTFKSANVRKRDTGEWQYVDENEQVISHKGIDVSSHQGEIDWKKVAGDGVEFAIIRAFYRGYETGKLVEDKQFAANISGALMNNLSVGVYAFTQAVTEKEVEEEVRYMTELLRPYKMTGPVVVDVEPAADGTGRMDRLKKEERTELVKIYCERLKEAGFRPMIYFNIETALKLLDLKQLEDYEKWFAVYDSAMYYPYEYTMWQYKETGTVNGIKDGVDMDIILEMF